MAANDSSANASDTSACAAHRASFMAFLPEVLAQTLHADRDPGQQCCNAHLIKKTSAARLRLPLHRMRSLPVELLLIIRPHLALLRELRVVAGRHGECRWTRERRRSIQKQKKHQARVTSHRGPRRVAARILARARLAREISADRSQGSRRARTRRS